MRIVGLGRALFAIGGAGLALWNLAYQDFALVGESVPPWISWRPAWVDGSAVMVLAGSVGLCFSRTLVPGILAVGIYLVVWVVARAIPIATMPLSVGSWYGLCEALAPLLGIWILYALLRGQALMPQTRFIAGQRAVRVAQALFGLCCMVYGLAHFAYAELTASMVPPWLPRPSGFAYFTGLGHLVAGAALTIGILPRLAATLEAIMMSLFGLLVWMPTLFEQHPPQWATPPRYQWSELIVSVLLAASAWMVAASFRSLPWGRRSFARPGASPSPFQS